MAGPPGHSNWVARLFNDLQNSLLFNRSFGPHFSVQTPFLTPKSPPQTTSWSSFFKPQLRYTIFLKNYTPPKRKPHFYMFCALKNISFLAPKSSQNRTFFKMPLETSFFQVFNLKIQFFCSNMEPNLGSKTIHFFTFSHREPKKPNGSPQDPPKPPWTPPGPCENL